MAFDLKGILKIGLVGGAGYLGYQVLKRVGGGLPFLTSPGGVGPSDRDVESRVTNGAPRTTVPPQARVAPTEANLIAAASNRATAAGIVQKFNFDQWTWYRAKAQPDHGIDADMVPFPEGIDRTTPITADQYHGLLELAGYEQFSRGFAGVGRLYHNFNPGLRLRRDNLITAGRRVY